MLSHIDSVKPKSPSILLKGKPRGPTVHMYSSPGPCYNIRNSRSYNGFSFGLKLNDSQTERYTAAPNSYYPDEKTTFHRSPSYTMSGDRNFKGKVNQPT